MLDSFIVRPYGDTKVIAMDKVMAKVEENKEPFIYVLQVKHNIKEWWFNVGFKDSNVDKAGYEWLKDRYRNAYLQLPK